MTIGAPGWPLVEDRDAPVAEMLAISASTAPLLDRAQDFLCALGHYVPYDGAWLALTDPGGHAYAVVGSVGIEASVAQLLDGPGTGRDLELAGYDRCGPPLSLSDLEVPLGDLPTWTTCLIPAGFREGLGVALFESPEEHVGFLGLLFRSEEAPSPLMRERLGRVAPLIARGLSPVRAVLASARLVPGAEAGALLLQDGTTCSLPGLRSHPLLRTGSPVVEIASEALGGGQVYRSFLWPADGLEQGPSGHQRVTVLAATEVPELLDGLLLVTPDGDCFGLTPRELEVLGLVVDGRSNQEIASRLAVAPRTVAAHLEHILRKLDVSSRTSAAVRAEREGCYVPPAPRRLTAVTPLPGRPQAPGTKTARTHPSSFSLNIW